MRVLVPTELETRLGEIRALSAGIEPVGLRIDRRRPAWARAAGFVARRRCVPYRLHRSLRPFLAGTERVSFRVDGVPLDSSNGGEVLLATWSIDGATARILVDALPDLLWIHSTSTGSDRFDPEQLRRRGIQLTAPRGVHSRRIAEFVMALIYSHAKRLDEHGLGAGHRQARLSNALELRDLTVGIVGYGSIGQEVARLGAANGLRMVAHVRERGRAPALLRVATTTDLGQVLATSDVLVLALPLTDATRGLIGRQAMRSMRRGAVLVNVGRSSTVVEEDLLAALRDGTIGRAYLDVLLDDDEVPPNHPILRIPGAVYTRHTAAASPRSGDEVFAGFVGNLRRYCAGEPLLDRVAPAEHPSGRSRERVAP